MALAKGGRMQGKVVNVSKNSFTVRLEGKGHEQHEKEMEFPLEDWTGPGAVVGAEDGVEYAATDSRSKPHAGDAVLVDLPEEKAADKRNASGR